MTRGGLIWFDLTRGTPTALRALRRRLGTLRLLRLLLGLAWRSLLDPFRGLSRDPTVSPNERLTRHQLKGVLLLDDGLRGSLGLDQDARVEILRDVVGRSGSRFLAWTLPPIDRARWEGLTDDERRDLAAGLMKEFFNMEARIVETSKDALAFEVDRCLFVSLCHELDRPYLAPLFCEADSVRFDDPAVPIALARSQTLARGGTCCDFRFSFEV